MAVSFRCQEEAFRNYDSGQPFREGKEVQEYKECSGRLMGWLFGEDLGQG